MPVKQRALEFGSEQRVHGTPPMKMLMYTVSVKAVVFVSPGMYMIDASLSVLLTRDGDPES